MSPALDRLSVTENGGFHPTLPIEDGGMRDAESYGGSSNRNALLLAESTEEARSYEIHDGHGSYQNLKGKSTHSPIQTDGSLGYRMLRLGMDTASVVRQYIRYLIHKQRGDGSKYQEIADKFGVSKPHVVNLHKHGRGSGRKVEEAAARIYFDGSVDRLREAAASWWESEGKTFRFPNESDPPPAPRPELVTERTEKPTELVELLAEERKNGREWPQGVIDAALSLRHLQGERLSHADWRTFLNEVELTGRRPLKVPAHQVPVPTAEEAAAAQAARIEAVLKRRRENQE